MANNPYPNYVLENKFEDQFNSYLDLLQFCTVDNSLQGTAGMTKKIRTYTATDGTETLAKGEGNTQTIDATYEDVDYVIELLQNRAQWYDEDRMEDPLVVDKALEHQAVDMFNTVNAKVIAEFAKATNEITVDTPDFNAFVDAIASFGAIEIGESRELQGLGIFAICHKDDVASLRKALGDLLKYVEAYARTGYIGTVAGVNIYISNIATSGEIYVATKDAVTYFNKVGTEVEQSTVGNRSADDANTRTNYAFLRKYGIAALTDQNYVVKMTITPSA